MVLVTAPPVAEEGILTPLGGPLMTDLGVLKVETPYQGKTPVSLNH
jgi:hypothetical protein